MWFPPDLPPERIPTTLWGQFRRQAPRYGLGMVLLGAYQYAQYWFDTHLSKAIDAAHARRYDERGRTRRGADRGGGRSLGIARAVAHGDVQRRPQRRVRAARALLHQLHALGPSFYRRMATGEIMSRATNDLAQVRLLLGFGVLNAINTVFAFASALAVTLHISGKLTLGVARRRCPLLFAGDVPASRARCSRASARTRRRSAR